jgi:hypothetical protein
MKKYLLLIFMLAVAFGQYRRLNIDAISPYYDGDADSTLQVINSGSGFLYAVFVELTSADTLFLRFYDTAEDTIAVGTVESGSVLNFEIAGTTATSAVVPFYFGPFGLPFQAGIKYAVMKSDSTDPTTGIRINAVYLGD